MIGGSFYIASASYPGWPWGPIKVQLELLVLSLLHDELFM